MEVLPYGFHHPMKCVCVGGGGGVWGIWCHNTSNDVQTVNKEVAEKNENIMDSQLTSCVISGPNNSPKSHDAA